MAGQAALVLRPPRRAANADARSARVEEKRRRRRDDILHAALRAFRDKGYHATTLDDIARHLGVRKTALYHYFPDKRAILDECHRESIAELERIIHAAAALPTAAAKLEHIIREHVRLVTETLDGTPLAFEVTAPPVNADGPGLQMEGRDRYERQIRAIIEKGMRAGEFRAGDPKVAAFVVLGALNWIARWYQPQGSLHAAELGDEFVERLLGGLRGAAAVPPPSVSVSDSVSVSP